MVKKSIILLLYSLCSLFFTSPLVFAAEADEVEITAYLQRLFHARANLLINQEPNTIAEYYSNTSKSSQYAFQLESRRADYLNAWAYERGVELVNASSEIIMKKIRIQGDVARVFVVQALRVDYIYPKKNMSRQSYGIGTRHSIALKKLDNRWYVIRDWYSDPMEEDPDAVPTQLPSKLNGNFQAPVELGKDNNSIKKNNKYDRAKAVAYADKYAGAAWGAGNNHSYNPKYPDYHYEGGDCTNFASQVLGDPLEGGGLKMTNGWRANRQAATRAWVQTDSFKNFLVYRGYGRVIATGTYRQLMTPTNRFPQGAIAALKPGDLIGYIMKKNDIDHFSIVVGKDSNGYVLVNSHTGDRYHVPWDIGWADYTKFVLIHIND